MKKIRQNIASQKKELVLELRNLRKGQAEREYSYDSTSNSPTRTTKTSVTGDASVVTTIAKANLNFTGAFNTGIAMIKSDRPSRVPSKQNTPVKKMRHHISPKRAEVVQSNMESVFDSPVEVSRSHPNVGFNTLGHSQVQMLMPQQLVNIQPSNLQEPI